MLIWGKEVAECSRRWTKEQTKKQTKKRVTHLTPSLLPPHTHLVNPIHSRLILVVDVAAGLVGDDDELQVLRVNRLA